MVLRSDLDRVAVALNSDNSNVNLFRVFDDTRTTGKVANFNFYDASFPQDINVLLFDQNGDGAPITVNNFINYVDDGDYVNSIIHRLVSNFVIQGGGFVVDDFNNFNNINITTVPTDPPIVNEFSRQRSNIRGTIAMAKQGGNPDSATSQWFFNLANNSANLNSQNGGFTVFGKVLSANDLNAIDNIASLPLPQVDPTLLFPIPPASDAQGNLFSPVPVNADPNNPLIQTSDNFIRLEDITISDLPELDFTILSNSNPGLVTPTINTNGRLILDYQDGVEGFADIRIRATNLLGSTITDTLRVSVVDNLDTPFFRFQNRNRPGTFVFVGENERDAILANFPQFRLEGRAFNVADDPDDGLIVFNRFQNTAVEGTYLYATEAESRVIRRDFSDEFAEEGIAFYAYGAGSGRGEDFFRFQNTNEPGTYIFVGKQERDSILRDFPQFELEGVAFEVLS